MRHWTTTPGCDVTLYTFKIETRVFLSARFLNKFNSFDSFFFLFVVSCWFVAAVLIDRVSPCASVCVSGALCWAFRQSSHSMNDIKMATTFHDEIAANAFNASRSHYRRVGIQIAIMELPPIPTPIQMIWCWCWWFFLCLCCSLK